MLKSVPPHGHSLRRSTFGAGLQGTYDSTHLVFSRRKRSRSVFGFGVDVIASVEDCDRAASTIPSRGECTRNLGHFFVLLGSSGREAHVIEWGTKPIGYVIASLTSSTWAIAAKHDLKS